VPARRRSSMRTCLRRPTEVVLEADDVVFAKVRAVLDFDEHDRRGPLILTSVRLTKSDVNAVARLQLMHGAVEHDRRVTVDYEPVFSALGVCLITESLPREDHDALHLVIEHLVVKDREAAPWSFVEFASSRVSRHHRTLSAASTALRNSIARVIGPTPPSRGVTQAATS